MMEECFENFNFYTTCSDIKVEDLIVINDDELVLEVFSKNGDVKIQFAIDRKNNYTTFTMINCKAPKGITLNFELLNSPKLHLCELDYMTSYSCNNDKTILSWNALSHHFGVNPNGAFALFEAENDFKYDETLLEIWVNENQPHPKVNEPWTLDFAKNWLDNWQRTFSNRSQMVVNGNSLEELYELVPYAEKANVDEIYVFTNTWRPTAFWPEIDLNWAINSKVFPNGRADIKAYSDHLASKNMRLAIHYVSGGIGFFDKTYIGKNIHPELAKWGKGRFIDELNSEAVSFKITNISELDDEFFKKRHFNSFALQIGDEIINPKKYSLDFKNNLLIVEESERAAFNTILNETIAKNSEVSFLVTPYDINFIPDNDSGLLYEIADNYADLLNECNIAHVEFDGAEIHRYNGSYGYIKFAQRIYEQTNHAVSSHDSTGSAARCFFEYRFKKSQDLLKGHCKFTHGNWLIPFQVDSLSRPAANMYDAQFFLSQGHYGGGMGISKPEPMFGVTPKILNTHGLSDKFFKLLRDWQTISKSLSTEEHQMIEDSLTRSAYPMPEASPHRIAETVYTVEDNTLVAMQTMTRENDIKWQLGQEFGTLSPRQIFRVGEEIELNNNLAAQTPNFLIKIMKDYKDNQQIKLATLKSTMGQTFEDKDFFVEGNEDNPAAFKNLTEEDIIILDETLELNLTNDTDKDLYQLSRLPECELGANLVVHGALELEIEGDNSGALLLIQLKGKGCRDYVCKVDFTGSKKIVIPNGECSWFRADWGWRLGTKCMDYSKVQTYSIALGMVKANSSANIKIHKISALRSREVSLLNPIIKINNHQMQLKGEVNSNEYLEYKGGESVQVYDLNWHLKREIEVVKDDNFIAVNGLNKIFISSEDNMNYPYIETQFMVQEIEI